MAITISLIITLTSFVPPMPGGQAGYGDEETPSFYLTPEIVSFGLQNRFDKSTSGPLTVRVASLDARWWRIRAGASLVEVGYSSWSWSLLPVRLGFTLWQRPQRYLWRLHGMLPEVYAQATAAVGLFRISPPPTEDFVGHAELRAATDMFGLGVDVGAGVVARYVSQGPPVPYRWIVKPVVDARVRLGVTNFGF